VIEEDEIGSAKQDRTDQLKREEPLLPAGHSLPAARGWLRRGPALVVQ
jgi:hypothetical protein